jgi:hypothetical protein
MRILLFLHCIETPPRHTAPHHQGAHRKTEIISFTSFLCAAIKRSPFWALKERSLVSGLSQTQDAGSREIYAGCCRKAITDSAEFRVGSDAQNNKLFEIKHSRNVTAPHGAGEIGDKCKLLWILL